MSDQTATIKFKVGPDGGSADGSEVLYPRTDRFHSARLAWCGGEYEEAASRGELYYACNQSAVTFEQALALATQTFTLYNPVGSLVDLVLLEIGVAIKTAGTAGSLVLAANVNNAAAAVTFASNLIVRNAKLDAAAGYGLASASATLPAVPVAIRTVAYGFVATGSGIVVDKVKGAVVLGPNTAVTVQGITFAGTGIISMLWRERKRLAT